MLAPQKVIAMATPSDTEMEAKTLQAFFFQKMDQAHEQVRELFRRDPQLAHRIAADVQKAIVIDAPLPQNIDALQQTIQASLQREGVLPAAASSSK